MADEVTDGGEEVSPRGTRSFVGRLRGQVTSSHVWTKSTQLYGTMYQPETNVNLNVQDEMVALVSKPAPAETAEVFVLNSATIPFVLFFVDSSGTLFDKGPLPAAVGTTFGKSQGIYGVRKDYVFLCLHPSEVAPGHLRDVRDAAVVFKYQVSSAEPVRHNLTISEITVEDKVQYTTKVDILTLDMMRKVYVVRRVCGIAVHCEKGLESNLELLCALHEDVAAVSLLLPNGIWEKLKQDCKIFVHIESKFGPVNDIVNVTGARVHNNWDWLLNQAYNRDMFQNVDISNAAGYVQSRNAWGTGGVLLHELCHAIHSRYVPNGLHNATIVSAYNAMKGTEKYLNTERKCFNSTVHSRENSPEAYCRTMFEEFWAELSGAYLWDRRGEYNIHYPYNREQLRNYDADSYNAIESVWTQLNAM